MSSLSDSDRRKIALDFYNRHLPPPKRKETKRSELEKYWSVVGNEVILLTTGKYSDDQELFELLYRAFEKLDQLSRE